MCNGWSNSVLSVGLVVQVGVRGGHVCHVTPDVFWTAAPRPVF